MSYLYITVVTKQMFAKYYFKFDQKYYTEFLHIYVHKLGLLTLCEVNKSKFAKLMAC